MTGSPNSGSLYGKQRAVPRFSFIASTEITDPQNAIRLSGRVTEISRNGCYVDTMNALPVGTVLNVQISCDQGKFSAKASIIYVHQGIGMGLAFTDAPEGQLKVLDSWLAGMPPAAAL